MASPRAFCHTLAHPANLLAIALTLLYWFAISKVGQLSHDHLVVLIPLGLFLLGDRARPIFSFLLPLFLTIVIYDSQRYFSDAIRMTVHVREPFEFDRTFFGIREGGDVLTPNQWLQRHTHPALDIVAGFFYIAFVPIFIAIAAYFRFWLARKRLEIMGQARGMMWAFFWLNMLGYSTYYWYPASPPWYVEQYGFGPARLDIPGSPAGCVRFDEALGTSIFNEWYGRAADVHGAIPSLHIAYPLLALFYAMRFRSLRWTSLGYYVALCFSAVYLNHHYVLDLIWGSAYAIVVGWLTMRWYERRPGPSKAVA